MIIVVAHAVARGSFGRTHDLGGTLALAGLVVLPVGLVAAILLALQWRLMQSSAAGWLGLLLGAEVVRGFATALARVLDPTPTTDLSAWMVLIDLALGLGLLLVVVVGEHAAWRRRGILVLAGAVLVVGAAVLRWPEAVVQSAPVVIVVAGALTAVAFRRQVPLPWLARRAAVALLCLAVTRAIADTAAQPAEVVLVALALGLVGSLLLCDTGLVLLASGLREEAIMLRGLHDQLESSVSAHRGDQERLHEITGTVAGIASATQLIERRDVVPPEVRHRLQDMLESETARLVRLLTHTREAPVEAPASIDLDTLIGRLVVSQEACGRRVRWSPSGLRVRGRPDELTEVLHILLENAAVHAPGSVATIEARRCGETVEVSVADSGPGIPATVAAGLFDWGARGPDSPGRGIGLHVAHRLSDANGGHLRHVPSPDGTTFVVDLALDRVAS